MRTQKYVQILFGMIFITACTPTSSPEITAIPSEVLIPTSAATITVCNPAEFIELLRQAMPYEEISISYNHSDTGDLTAWFVDPELDPQASASDIQDMTKLAIRHSAEVVHLLAATEPCVAAIFDSLTVIAVDRTYHAWYQGAMIPSSIPLAETLSEDQWTEFEGLFDAGYQRTEEIKDGEVTHLPEGSCTWPEVNQKLIETFTPGLENVGFYYYIEPDEASVHVQWTVLPLVEKAEQMIDYFFVTLPQIDQAVTCLYPPFDTLWLTYVRQDGEAQWIFAVNGDAVRAEDHQEFIDNLEPIYQTSEGLNPASTPTPSAD